MTRAANSGELTKLRSDGQWARWKVIIDRPDVIYTASATGSMNQPSFAISFDGGSGTLTNIKKDMTVRHLTDVRSKIRSLKKLAQFGAENRATSFSHGRKHHMHPFLNHQDIDLVPLRKILMSLLPNLWINARRPDEKQIIFNP